MRPGIFLLPAMFMGACGQESSPPAGNLIAANRIMEEHANQCVPPSLSFLGVAPSQSSLPGMDETEASFSAAYKRLCGKGLLKGKTLINSKAADRERLFLVNAPEANVASIYLSEVDGNRMVLEYPFLTLDGKSQVPSADELEEAIYCAVVGATPREQESHGRCLAD
jgi:hypothetical protein